MIDGDGRVVRGRACEIARCLCDSLWKVPTLGDLRDVNTTTSSTSNESDWIFECGEHQEEHWDRQVEMGVKQEELLIGGENEGQKIGPHQPGTPQ